LAVVMNCFDADFQLSHKRQQQFCLRSNDIGQES
jgi:hypothetical protein